MSDPKRFLEDVAALPAWQRAAFEQFADEVAPDAEQERIWQRLGMALTISDAPDAAPPLDPNHLPNASSGAALSASSMAKVGAGLVALLAAGAAGVAGWGVVGWDSGEAQRVPHRHEVHELPQRHQVHELPQAPSVAPPSVTQQFVPGPEFAPEPSRSEQAAGSVPSAAPGQITEVARKQSSAAGGSEVQGSPPQSEAQMVGRARRALRTGDAPAALGILDDLERLHPRGVLAQERLALRVEALLRAGDRTRARQQAEVFLRRFPNSGYLGSVRRALEPG